MKVYSVDACHLENGLEMNYGIYSTVFKAKEIAKEKPLNMKFDNLVGLTVSITEYEVDTDKQTTVYSWILRDNLEFTPETEADCEEWLVNNADKYGYALV